jgi:predicted DNA-binding WGR domain protein
MIRRELIRSGSANPVAIALWGQAIAVQPGAQGITIRVNRKNYYLEVSDPTVGRGGGGAFDSESDARKWLRSELLNLSRQGFEETPCSQSRQEFMLGRGRVRRFWAIETDGLRRRIWCGRAGYDGGFRDRTFSTIEELQSSCRQLIRKRLRQGYRRLNRRTFQWE